MYWARSPSSAATAAPWSSRISVTTTRAPSVTKRRAAAAPMPPAAPVTSATRPARRGEAQTASRESGEAMSSTTNDRHSHRHLQQPRPVVQLDSIATEPHPVFLLGSIDGAPASPADNGLAAPSQKADRIPGRSGAPGPGRADVIDQCAHRLGGIWAVRTDHPGRAALDPSDGVQAGNRSAGVNDPSGIVRDRT